MWADAPQRPGAVRGTQADPTAAWQDLTRALPDQLVVGQRGTPTLLGALKAVETLLLLCPDQLPRGEPRHTPVSSTETATGKNCGPNCGINPVCCMNQGWAIFCGIGDIYFPSRNVASKKAELLFAESGPELCLKWS